MGLFDKMLQDPPTAERARQLFNRAIGGLIVQLVLMLGWLASMVIRMADLFVPIVVLFLTFHLLMLGFTGYYALDYKAAFHRLQWRAVA